MMEKAAFIFAGQGAQYIGMGRDLYDNYVEIKQLYDEASSILGYDLTEICFRENNFLQETAYAQPAIFVTSFCLYKIFRMHVNTVPAVFAGFSLGEYSALCAAGAFSFRTGVEIVSKRGGFMSRSSLAARGAMAAVISYPKEKLADLCEKVGNVWIVNYNCPTQYVISGMADAVQNVCFLAKEDGARRTVMLNVSGAFHTSFMARAAEEMKSYLSNKEFSVAFADVLMNTDALPLGTRHLPDLMVRQIVSPVLFEDIIRKMIKDYHTDVFIEIGPGNVLSGFVRKIDSARKVISIGNIDDIKKYKWRPL